MRGSAQLETPAPIGDEGPRLDHPERIVEAAQRPRVLPRDLRLERHDSFEGLRPEWNELAAAGGSIFATWEWAATWWRHFGSGRPLLLTTCRAVDGRLVAVLPLYRFSGRPVRVVRFVGHGPADQLGPICLPEDRAVAARCLRRALDAFGAEIFVGEQLLREEGWTALLGGRVVRTGASPALSLNASNWDALLATWSVNLRKKLRQYERKLAREHALRYRSGGDDLAADLDEVLALHRARWGTSAYAGRHERFHRDFAAVADAEGWLRLWLLELDGRPVAAWHGFRFGGVESAYQLGRDPTWLGPGVGTILSAHTIRAALEDGMREYRFLRGDEEYKFRFASHDPGLETIGIGRGALGNAVLAAASRLPRRLSAPLRRRLTR